MNRHRRRAFTLIELLLVLVILGLLAGIVVPKLAGRKEQANVAKAKADIANYKMALSNFEVDNGRFPTTDEGLKALVEKPADMSNWKGYVEKISDDPWGHPYVYRFTGNEPKAYDLFSMGPDGNEGGSDNVEP
jgi:general secretion pathway protein G